MVTLESSAAGVSLRSCLAGLGGRQTVERLILSVLPDARHVQLRRLSGGISGAGVLSVHADNYGPGVIKVSDTDSARHEYENWQALTHPLYQYRRPAMIPAAALGTPFRRRNIVLYQHVAGITVGRRVAELIWSGQPTVARSLLHELFLDIEGLRLSEDFAWRRLSGQGCYLMPPARLEQFLRFCGAQETRLERFGSREHLAELFDASSSELQQVLLHKSIHGDLNTENALVDHEDRATLIDFGLSGVGHFLRDFLTLETHLVFRTLHAGLFQEQDQDEHYATFEPLWRGESFVPAASNPALHVVGECRRHALEHRILPAQGRYQHAGYSHTTPLAEYYFGLLRHAIGMATRADPEHPKAMRLVAARAALSLSRLLQKTRQGRIGLAEGVTPRASAEPSGSPDKHEDANRSPDPESRLPAEHTILDSHSLGPSRGLLPSSSRITSQARTGGDPQQLAESVAARPEEESFVGRKDVQALFSAMTRQPARDPRILVAIGDGGHGKTTLLDRLRHSAGRSGAFVVSAALQPESSELDIMAQLVSGALTGRAPSYSAALQQHMSEIRLAADRQVDVDRGIRLISGAFGSGGELLDSSGRLVLEQRLLQASLSVVTNAFLADLTVQARDGDPLVLVLDDYHRASNQVDRWLREVLKRKDAILKGSLFLIASRSRLTHLSQEWTNFEPAITEISVTPFTQSEVRDYLSGEKTASSNASVAMVMAVTGGVPWLVSRASAVLSDNPKATRAIVEEGIRGLLVPRALSHIPGAAESVLEVLNAASIVRTFDEDLLAATLGRDVGSDFLAIEEETNIFQRVPGGWQIHEPVAEQARRDFRARHPDRFRTMCERASAILAERATAARSNPITSFHYLVRQVALTCLYDVDKAMRLLTDDADHLRGVSVGAGNPIASLLHAIALNTPDVAEHPEFVALSSVMGLASNEIDDCYEALASLLRDGDPRLSRRTRIVVLSALIDACHRRGNVLDAIEWCREGGDVAREEGDREAQAVFRVREAETHGVLGNAERSKSTLSEGEGLLEGLGTSAVAAEGWIVAGYVYAARGEASKAVAVGTAAVQRAPSQHAPVISALRNNLAAWAHTIDGDVEAGIPSAIRAIEFFSNEVEDAFHSAVASLNLAELHLAAAEYPESIDALDLAQRSFDAVAGGRGYRLNLLADRTTALLAKHQYPEVEVLIDDSLNDPTTRRDDAYNHGRVLLNRAIARHNGNAHATRFLSDAEPGLEMLLKHDRGRYLAGHWAYLAVPDGDSLRRMAEECGEHGYWDIAAEGYIALASLAATDAISRKLMPEFILRALESALAFNVFRAAHTYAILRDTHSYGWKDVQKLAQREHERLESLVNVWSHEARRPRARERDIKVLDRRLELTRRI